MPYTTNVNAYPLHLYNIVENVLHTFQPVRVETANRKAADKLRKQIYGLKGALIASKEHPLSEQAIKITTEQHDNVLVITHVDHNVDPGLIKASQQIDEDK